MGPGAYGLMALSDCKLYIRVIAENAKGTFKVLQSTWYAGKRKPDKAVITHVWRSMILPRHGEIHCYTPVDAATVPPEVMERFAARG